MLSSTVFWVWHHVVLDTGTNVAEVRTTCILCVEDTVEDTVEVKGHVPLKYRYTSTRRHGITHIPEDNNLKKFSELRCCLC
jgi:hypothetical protein